MIVSDQDGLIEGVGVGCVVGWGSSVWCEGNAQGETIHPTQTRVHLTNEYLSREHES